jgi:hypothetical protein
MSSLKLFYVLLLFLIFNSGGSLANAAAILLDRTDNSTKSSSHNRTCNFSGNPDLYGLGIRLGVYLQLCSTLLANHFLPEVLRDAWDANAVFLLAIFIAIIKSSVSVGNLTAPEAFVMLQMLLAVLLAVFNISGGMWFVFDFTGQLLDKRVNRKTDAFAMLSELGLARSNTSPLGILARSLLGLSIASYNVWFWFGGSRRLDSDIDCATSVFLFARVDLHGNATLFFKVIAAIYLAYKACQITWQVGPVPQLLTIVDWLSRHDNDKDVGGSEDPRPSFRNMFLSLIDPRSRFGRKNRPLQEYFTFTAEL